MHYKMMILLMSMIFMTVANLRAEENKWAGTRANTRFRIVCLQQGEDHRATGNPGVIKNITALMQLAREAAETNPDIIVFPEYATTGWPYPDPEVIRGTGEKIPGGGKLFTLYQNLAKELALPIIGWLVEKEEDLYYNTSFLLDVNGNYINKYRKIHTNLREQNVWGFTPGDSFKIFEVDSCKIGMSICADMWFPETVMCLSLSGADIVIHQSVGDDMGWVIPTRARDHFIPIVTAILEQGTWGVDQWGEILRKGSRFHEYNVFDVYPFRQVITERLGGWYPKMGRRAYRNPKAYSIITDTLTIPLLTEVFCDPKTGKTRSKKELYKKFPTYTGK